MKKLWTIICVLSIVGCIASGTYAYRYQQNLSQGQTENQSIQDLAHGKKSSWLPSLTVTVYAEEAEEQTSEQPENPIDFAAIQAVNQDIYAWITVPGTNVDYPVLQDPNQTEGQQSIYLDHGLNKEYLFSGCIYSEKRNEKDFKDFNTILYGHNMKDGSMFASLHRFRDRKFFDENREIWVYTPEHVYHYLIFATYKYDNRHILNWWNFDQKDVEVASEEERKEKQEFQKKQYLRDIYDIRAMDAYILDDPIVKPEDRIITLSTCINDHNYRYLVQGVLTEVDGEPFDPLEEELEKNEIS